MAKSLLKKKEEEESTKAFVKITLKGKWKDYSAVAFGFEFENGVCLCEMDVAGNTRDEAALNNLCCHFPGANAQILTEEELDVELARLDGESEPVLESAPESESKASAENS